MMRPALGLLTAIAIMAAACATSGEVPRPAPFPTADSSRSAGQFRATLAVDVAPILDTALALRGTPYRLGGGTPDEGFDCSGFVHYVFGMHGIEVPRTVVEQFDTGTKNSMKNIRPGDLLFFATTAPGPTHVGIALADGRFVHAPGTNASVRIDSIATPYWRDRFVGARRLPI